MMKMRRRSCLLQIAWTSILLKLCLGMATENVKVELHAPRFVHHGSSATLRCEHNVQPEEIYKVEFQKYGTKIFQYVRERNPPYNNYNTSGAFINAQRATPKSITLENMKFSASGIYNCEVVLEHPIYTIVSKDHEIAVIQPQKHPPKIKLSKRQYLSLEVLEASCISAPAHPAPYITWFVNNHKVDESLTKPIGAVRRHIQGLQLFSSTTHLYYPLSQLHLKPNDTLELSCISTIPSYVEAHHRHYADIKNKTIFVHVIQAENQPTQLPVILEEVKEQPTLPPILKSSAMVHQLNILLAIMSIIILVYN